MKDFKQGFYPTEDLAIREMAKTFTNVMTFGDVISAIDLQVGVRRTTDCRDSVHYKDDGSFTISGPSFAGAKFYFLFIYFQT